MRNLIQPALAGNKLNRPGSLPFVKWLKRRMTVQQAFAGLGANRWLHRPNLHRAHVVVVLLSLGLTIFAWQHVKTEQHKRIEQRFDREVAQTVGLFTDRLQRYVDILWANVSMLSAQDEPLSSEEWKVYTDRLDLATQFPAGNGFGVGYRILNTDLPAFLAEQNRDRPGFSLIPDLAADVHYPLTHIVPKRYAMQLLGMDAAHDPILLSTLEKAALSNEAQATSLVSQSSREASAIVFLAPFYRSGEAPPEALRLQEFAGWVGASILIDRLAEGVLSEDRRDVRIRISDDHATLYDELSGNHDNTDSHPLLQRTVTIPLYGRTWQIELHSARSFRDAVENYNSTLVLTFGLILDVVILWLLVTLSRAGGVAQRLAKNQTGALEESIQQLAQSNAELELFASAVSHDLKTPIRGIASLADFAREDMACFDGTDDRDQLADSITEHVHRIQSQTMRAHSLVDGVLGYYKIGCSPGSDSPPTPIDTATLLSQLSNESGIDAHRLRLEGASLSIRTDVKTLKLCLLRLIDNAFMHHHQPDSALVTLSVQMTQDQAIFTVSDNGPGIEDRFHQRIFDLFSRLQTYETCASSGIGLAYVRKCVELRGGTISVTSTPKAGSIFTLAWPLKTEERHCSSAFTSRKAA